MKYVLYVKQTEKVNFQFISYFSKVTVSVSFKSRQQRHGAIKLCTNKILQFLIARVSQRRLASMMAVKRRLLLLCFSNILDIKRAKGAMPPFELLPGEAIRCL